MDLELQTLERRARRLIGHAGSRNVLNIALTSTVAAVTGTPSRPSFIVACFTGVLGLVAMMGSSGFIDARTGSTSHPIAMEPAARQRRMRLRQWGAFSHLLALLAVGLGFASLPAVALGLVLAMVRARQDLLLKAGATDEVAGLLPPLLPTSRRRAVSQRFSVSWALWRGPTPIAPQAFLLLVALAGMWVNVSLPRFPLGRWTSLVIILIGGVAVVSRELVKGKIERNPAS